MTSMRRLPSLLSACAYAYYASRTRGPPPAEAAAALRSFSFDARVRYAPLLRSLPDRTAIYREWPPAKLRKALPDYVSAALVASRGDSDDNDDDDEDLRLLGPPIHVQAGDVLSVTLRNSLPATGLSLHWHGFEMSDALEYDGVTGVTQCPISPHEEFAYEFKVEEVPGTYWWHTHSVRGLVLFAPTSHKFGSCLSRYCQP